MAQSLLGRLQSLGPRELNWSDPGDPGTLDALEAEFGFTFPDDYREVMQARDGFGLARHRTALNVLRARGLSEHNADEEFEEGLPGMFVIGTDGGGSVYFYDPQGRLGKGRWALFLVPLSDLDFAESRFVGTSLAEVVDAILRDEDFHARPRLGPGPASAAE
ncbi:MAG TPA: SMI1/KNR4 family protein [Longimicrobiaceae bacterium]|nr:SMI1/KNR4 family protein [Longimicrobiaceae bacterium]